MYFFVIIFAAVYWIIYGNWIGGCLMASLFLILIYSISCCKKEEKQLEFNIKAQDVVIKEGEELKLIPEITGLIFGRNDYIFDIEYEMEGSFRHIKKKKKIKLCWRNESKDQKFFTEKIKECDHYIFRIKSIAWNDLTGSYRVKKEISKEISVLVMPRSYELGRMNEKLRSMKLGAQGFEYDGVRAYQEGDKLSRIHWNLYAATRQLWVRKSEEEVEDYMKLGIDLCDLDQAQISDYFSVFYSISLFYMEEGIWQEIYYGTHCFLLKDIEQYEELFTDIFQEGLQRLSGELSKVQIIRLNDQERNIEKYIYDMEL